MVADHGPDWRSLAVCITTYNRPVDLERLLSQLAQVDRPGGSVQWTRTIVIDNSPHGNADQVVGRAPPDLAVAYVHEPRPGLSAARNRAVAAAGTDYVAFIDDDELPTPGWLMALTRTLEADLGVAAVMGPVHYAYDEPAPAWLADTGVFDEPTLIEGAAPDYLATGNALIRTDLVADLGPLFDERFGVLGGEDHHLGLRLEQAGLRIVGSPEAIVHERVPAGRLEPRWIRTRLLRKGGSLAVTELALFDGNRVGATRTRLRHVAKGGARILMGTAVAFSSIATRSRSAWAGGRYFYMGVGEIRGALGRPVGEYHRP